MPNRKDRSNMSSADRVKWAQSIKTVSTQVRVHMRELAGAVMYLDLHKRNPSKKAEVVALCFHTFIWEKVHAGKIILPETTEAAWLLVKEKLDLTMSGDDMEALAYQLMAEDEGLIKLDSKTPTEAPIQDVDTITVEESPTQPRVVTTKEAIAEINKQYAQGLRITSADRDKMIEDIIDNAPTEELTQEQRVMRQARVDAKAKQDMKDAMSAMAQKKVDND